MNLQALRRVFPHLPLILATLGLLFGGTFLLHRSEAQARDTIRKHHLQDVEEALYFAYTLHGTYPPYELATWCGYLSETSDGSTTHAEIETALRQQHELYAKNEKPFPQDPLLDPVSAEALAQVDRTPDYFYWKRSPAVFELYSILETDPNGTRSTIHCPARPDLHYDYGINSRLRTSTTIQ